MSGAEINSISPNLFLKMVFVGGKQIILSEDELNQLNVYPVPDSDTGSNMAALMRYILAQTYPTGHFDELLTALADASLIGSCGNSGMILSAFFVGLAKYSAAAKKNVLSVHDFIDCLASGVKQAHQSVAHPVEGTILTVMQSWLNACLAERTHCESFGALFLATIPAAEAALKQTEFLLPALRENHVIDAGAFGFTKFIQGMNLGLLDPDRFDLNWEQNENHQQPAQHHAHHATIAADAYQYCMETLLASTQDNLDALRTRLDDFCDCVVLNQSPSHIKIHAHTDDILGCTELFTKYGHIIHQKIDDIKVQAAINEHRKHNIAIVTDSSADMPQGFRESAQIHVIPNQVRVGEHTLLDRLTINLTTLFAEAGKPNFKTSTAAPSAEIVRRYLQFLSSHYDSIIVISLSSRLSSTYQVMQNQAEHVSNATGVKINVVDSRSLCSGHGLLVMKAAKMLDAGSSHDEIVTTLESERDKIRIYVAIDEMKTVRESGRLSKIMHKIADWGHVKPLLSIDKAGQTTLAGIALGKLKAWKKISTLFNKHMKPAANGTILLSYTTSPEAAAEFAHGFTETTGAKITATCNTSSSIGVHAGRGAVAIAVYPEKL